jgi:hypothetical protein
MLQLVGHDLAPEDIARNGADRADEEFAEHSCGLSVYHTFYI